MEFTITKEQILEVAKWGNSQNEKQIKEWFPEAFKAKLEVGKWYKHNEKGNLLCLTKVTKDAAYGYGFLQYGKWFHYTNHSGIHCACNSFNFKHLIEATDKEVEEALVKEAKKRGYKKNVSVLPLFSSGEPFYNNYNNIGVKTIYDDDFVFDSNENSLDFNNSSVRIFCNGKWAEIISQEKTTISKEKALKILAKKLKVSPENIEIK